MNKAIILGAALALAGLTGAARAQQDNTRQGANQAMQNTDRSHEGDNTGGNPDPRFNQAVDDYNAKRYGQAAGELKEYLRGDAKNVAAHKMLASALVQQNKLAEAVPELEAVVRLAPKDADGHSNLGAIYLQTGQFDKAAGVYQVLHERKPKDAEAAYFWGVALVQGGKFAEAAAALRGAIALKPTAPAYLQLGSALAQSDKSAEAAAAFEAASVLDPKNAQAVLNAGMLYHQGGQDDKAAPLLQKAAALGTPDAFGAHMVLAEIAAHAGKTDDAIQQYKLASAARPGNFGAAANLGVLNQNAGRKADAVAAYRQALTLKTKSPLAVAQVQASLAGLIAKDSPDEAVTLLTQATQGAPQSARIAASLGQLYENQGKPDLAAAAYQKAVALDPHQPESVAGLARLKLKK